MNPPKMPIHIGDLMRDTGHLRAPMFGAYLALLFHHWATGSLPDDDDQLSAIARMSPAEWKKARPVLEKFFKPGWVHSRVLEDLEESRATYEKLAAAGAKGGKAKAANKRRSSPATSPATSGATSKASSDAVASLKQPLTFNQSDSIGEGARASDSAFTEGSRALAAALWKALGFRTKLEITPEFAGADWRAIEWEQAGWTVDLIETEARRIGPNKPLSYHEKVFATAFAKRQAPLPVVDIRQAETLTVTHGKPRSPIIQAADDLCRRIASFDGPQRGPDELRGEQGQDPPRLLSNG